MKFTHHNISPLMKRLLASLLALVGASSSAQDHEKPKMMDPKAILFSVSTLSDDLAPLEPVNGTSSQSVLSFHEDDWSQVEFLPKSMLPEVQQMLKEFKIFEKAQRAQVGWKNVYVRKIQRKPLIAGPGLVQQLEKILGVKAGPAPILSSSGSSGARVKNGFTLVLGGNVTLYGYTTELGIPVLGASVGENPDDLKLAQAFMKLNSSSDLMLVDWRAQMLLVSVTASGRIDIWRP